MKKQGVYFVSGFSPRKGLIGIVAYLNEFANTEIEHSRFYMIHNKKWHHREIKNHEIRSVTYTSDPAWWLLSKRGMILKITPQGISQENIKSAEEKVNGNLTFIKNINGIIFSCGFRRQVFWNKNKNWELISHQIIPKEKTNKNFLCLDGFSEKDIYAGGTKGDLFHFNGSSWSQIAIETNLSITSILCSTDGNVYICGKKGFIAKGLQNKWEVIAIDQTDDNFWDIAEHNGIIYISTIRKLYKLIDSNLVEDNIESYKLTSNGQEIWSIGQREVFNLHKSNWKEVKCPDN